MGVDYFNCVWCGRTICDCGPYCSFDLGADYINTCECCGKELKEKYLILKYDDYKFFTREKEEEIEQTWDTISKLDKKCEYGYSIVENGEEIYWFNSFESLKIDIEADECLWIPTDEFIIEMTQRIEDEIKELKEKVEKYEKMIRI